MLFSLGTGASNASRIACPVPVGPPAISTGAGPAASPWTPTAYGVSASGTSNRWLAATATPAGATAGPTGLATSAIGAAGRALGAGQQAAATTATSSRPASVGRSGLRRPSAPDAARLIGDT